MIPAVAVFCCVRKWGMHITGSAERLMAALLSQCWVVHCVWLSTGLLLPRVTHDVLVVSPCIVEAALLCAVCELVLLFC